MENLLNHIQKFVDLRESELELFRSKLYQIKFEKKEQLISVGKVEGYLYFIDNGIVRFYIPNEDRDTTFAFGFKNQFVSAYDSFLTRSPAKYQIESLTAIHAWRLSYQDLQDLYDKIENGERLGRLIAELLLLKKLEREVSLLKYNAEQRYFNLYSEQPKLIEHIPLKYIASYIGVQPESLSRIRAKIS